MNYLFIVLSVILFSCATERPVGKTEAEVLYKEAAEMVKDGHFLMATEKLNTIRSKYPYSFFATGAELLQADILYDQESYVEAAAAYILFRDFHPKHPKIPYVVFRIAEAYFKQLPSTFDRDLSPTADAIKYYEELIFKYPGSEHVKDAKKNIKKMKEKLGLKQKYIADFYFKTEVYKSARYRYRDILKGVLFDEGLRDYFIERVLLSSLMAKDREDCLSDYVIYRDKASKEFISKIDKIKSDCEKLAENKKDGEEEETSL